MWGLSLGSSDSCELSDSVFDALMVLYGVVIIFGAGMMVFDDLVWVF